MSVSGYIVNGNCNKFINSFYLAATSPLLKNNSALLLERKNSKSVNSHKFYKNLQKLLNPNSNNPSHSNFSNNTLRTTFYVERSS